MSALLNTQGIADALAIDNNDISGSFTANTWYDTGIGRGTTTGAPSGGNRAVFVMGIFINGYLAGFGSMYSCLAYTSPFSWNTTSVNSISATPLRYSGFTAHAPNTWQGGYAGNETLQLRIKHEYSNGQNGWRIQWLATVNTTLNPATSGKQLSFWLKRLA